jgi:hypothetical protein
VVFPPISVLLVSLILFLHCDTFYRVPKSDIKALVHKFVASRNQINANDLSELENEVRDLMKNRKNKQQNATNLPGMNSNPENDDNKEGGIFRTTASGTRLEPCECDNCLVGKPCLVLPKGREWEALNMFQAYQAGIKDMRDKEAHKKKQQELKAALDAQVREQNLRFQNEKSEDRDYLKFISNDLKKFNDENQAKLERENTKHARERSFWEAQINDDNARHQREKEKMIREEQRDLRRMQKKVSEEQRLIQEKKDKEAQIHRAIMNENAKNKLLHQERMAQERAEDNRVMEEYANRLDAEEKRRQDAFAKRMSDLEKIVQMADDGPVGKGRRDQERREEELLLKQQLAKDEADARRERNDLQAKLERNRVMAAHNKQLLEEQEKLKREAKEKDKGYSEHYKRVGREYQAEVSRSKQAEVEKCLRQRKVLQDQIDSKRRLEEDMNMVERSINHDTINDIRKDVTFQGRLQHRVRMARGQQSSSRPNTPNSARSQPKAKKNGWM